MLKWHFCSLKCIFSLWHIIKQYIFTGYKGLRGVTGGYGGLQGVTVGYKGLQGVKKGYKGLQGVRGETERLKWICQKKLNQTIYVVNLKRKP